MRGQWFTVEVDLKLGIFGGSRVLPEDGPDPIGKA